MLNEVFFEDVQVPVASLVGNASAQLANNSTALPSQAGSVKRKFGFLAPSTTTPFRAALRS